MPAMTMAMMLKAQGKPAIFLVIDGRVYHPEAVVNAINCARLTGHSELLATADFSGQLFNLALGRMSQDIKALGGNEFKVTTKTTKDPVGGAVSVQIKITVRAGKSR
ncbi:MAG: hypothetical protein V1846_03775 [Candidatus Komeilibacteria bacterium]